MKKRIFTGAGTALVTPFNEDYSVNYDALRFLVNDQIEKGIDSLIICGTTGEGSTLSHEEHVKVIAEAIEVANGRVPIVAGTGSNDTAYSVKLSKEAAALGADALLQVTPYYNKTSQRGLIAHYTEIAKSVDLPMILYNVPSRTGMKIAVDTYKQLSKIDNIVATKEASGDLELVRQIREVCGDDLDIYSGNDDQVYDILKLGGIGVISVFSNIFPKELHELCQHFFDGNEAKSEEMQKHYLEIMNGLFMDVNPIPVKDAMSMLGINVGPLRLPLLTMDDEHKAQMLALLKKYGLLK